MVPPTPLAALRGLGLLVAAPRSMTTAAAAAFSRAAGGGVSLLPLTLRLPARPPTVATALFATDGRYLAPTLESARAEAGARVRTASSSPDARADGGLLIDGLLASR